MRIMYMYMGTSPRISPPCGHVPRAYVYAAFLQATAERDAVEQCMADNKAAREAEKAEKEAEEAGAAAKGGKSTIKKGGAEKAQKPAARTAPKSTPSKAAKGAAEAKSA